jgi:hypothetical protein
VRQLAMRPRCKRSSATRATAADAKSRHRTARHPITAVQLAVLMPIVAIVLVGCGAGAPTMRKAETSTNTIPTTGIPPALLREARPIGSGPRFHPPATGPVIGRCRPSLGPRSGVHVELFAANRVVLVAAGIGTRRPYTFSAGRISSAACYSDLVTLEPTGLVLVRPKSRLHLSDLFRGWGQPLSSSRLASFRALAGTGVTVFVDGLRWRDSPGSVPLAPHSEIVLEVGPHVPPHRSYTFPPGT